MGSDSSIESVAEMLAVRTRQQFVSTTPQKAVRTGFKLKGRKGAIIEEVKFLDQDGGTCGYALLSNSRGFPPVFAFSVTPNEISFLLEKDLVFLLQQLKCDYESWQWYYFGPFEIVAEVRMRARGFLYVRVPNFSWVYKETQIHFNEVDNLEDNQVFESLSANAIILKNCTPVRYNQVCPIVHGASSSQGVDEQESTISRLSHLKGFNHCAPDCITGCTPVAWAVTAGGFKRALGYQGQLIFNGSQNWQQDWDQDPLDKVVDSEIWRVHNACATGCNGNTSVVNVINGHAIFGDGPGVLWKRSVAPAFSDCLWLIKNNMPFVLSASSKWDKYGVLIGAEPGDVGHSVFCYGADEGSQMLFVSLGWGFWHRDVWIPFSELRQLDIVYRAFPLPLHEGQEEAS